MIRVRPSSFSYNASKFIRWNSQSSTTTDLEQHQNKLRKQYEHYLGKRLVSDNADPIPHNVKAFISLFILLLLLLLLLSLL